MEALFKSKTTFNKSIHYQVLELMLPRMYFAIMYVPIIAIIIHMAIGIYIAVSKGDSFLNIVGMDLVFIGIFSAIYLNLYRPFALFIYRMNQKKNFGRFVVDEFIVFEDHIMVKETLSESKEDTEFYSSDIRELEFTFDTVKHALQTDSLFLLVYPNRKGLTIEKANFTLGTSSSFEEFLIKKGITVTHRRWL